MKGEKERIEFYAKIGEKGRITIPLANRKALGLKKGDIVKVIIIVEKKEELL